MFSEALTAQTKILTRAELKKQFLSPPESASPWVFWYWNQASVSPEGITADLNAMKQSGIGGAYLMTIKDTANPPLMKPVTRQLTPRMVEDGRIRDDRSKAVEIKTRDACKRWFCPCRRSLDHS